MPRAQASHRRRRLPLFSLADRLEDRRLLSGYAALFDDGPEAAVAEHGDLPSHEDHRGRDSVETHDAEDHVGDDSPHVSDRLDPASHEHEDDVESPLVARERHAYETPHTAPTAHDDAPAASLPSRDDPAVAPAGTSSDRSETEAEAEHLPVASNTPAPPVVATTPVVIASPPSSSSPTGDDTATPIAATPPPPTAQTPQATEETPGDDPQPTSPSSSHATPEPVQPTSASTPAPRANNGSQPPTNAVAATPASTTPSSNATAAPAPVNQASAEVSAMNEDDDGDEAVGGAATVDDAAAVDPAGGDADTADAGASPTARGPVTTTAVADAARRRSGTLATHAPEAAPDPARIVEATERDAAVPAGVSLADRVAAQGAEILHRGADLLASFTPFDRAGFEQAVDQFLDGLDARAIGSNAAGGGLRAIVAVGVGLAVAETARRRLARPWDAMSRRGPAGGLGFPELSGLPRHWAMED